MPGTFSSHPIDHNADQEHFIIIENAYVLYKKDNEYFITHLKKLVDFIIITQIQKAIDSDEWISPLLVSEPFTSSNTRTDKSFEELKKIGFEFDRLNREVIILRTIPKLLPRPILKYSVLSLLDFTYNHAGIFKLTNFENYLSKKNECDIPFNLNLVKSLLSLATKDDKSFTVKLDKNNIGSFFK
jgi:DNA mismatch repair ATPase MutL